MNAPRTAEGNTLELEISISDDALDGVVGGTAVTTDPNKKKDEKSVDIEVVVAPQVDSLEHLGKRHTGVLKHGANLGGELRAAFATLLEAEANLAFRVLLARLRADAG